MVYKYFLQTLYMLNKIVSKSIIKIPNFYQRRTTTKCPLKELEIKVRASFQSPRNPIDAALNYEQKSKMNILK